MRQATALSSTLHGTDGLLVEVDLGAGLARFSIVGLAEGAVRESKDRVRAALKNGGYTVRAQRITVNLAPADVKKDGAAFDLPPRSVPQRVDGRRELHAFCVIEPAAERLLQQAMEKLALSARAYARILKVARTIADLDGSGPIRVAHVAEAVQYRSLDRAARI